MEIATKGSVMEKSSQGVQPNEDTLFIVKLNATHFFYTFGATSAEVLGTQVLSEAEHMNYRSADYLTQDLRTRGYDAVACDRYGHPVTEEMLKVHDVPPIPKTAAEFLKIPYWAMRRRFYSETEFRKRLEAAIAAGTIERPRNMKA
jgi:hypothetical protein